MPVAVLTARPGALPDDLPARLALAWGGDDPRWLAPAEAAEIALPATPADAEARAADLRTRGIDLNLIPAEGRRKRLLLADMDSTMIGQECIDELAEVAGAGPAVRAITARAMNGELDFDSALRERVAALAGLDTAVIADLLASRITDAPGARQLVATMRAQGARAVLVSGGFTAFSAVVAARQGFDAHRANVLHVADGRLTGTVAAPILGRQAKIDTLHAECAALGIPPAAAIAIGDGANDLGMLGAAGAGVAVHAKPAVAAQARLRIEHGDLTAVLYLQGYARADFAL